MRFDLQRGCVLQAAAGLVFVFLVTSQMDSNETTARDNTLPVE
jgi:hypothetical protein